MRVVIVEDEPISRDALRLRLEREPDIEVVGEASSGQEAIAAILELRPDAVFLDIEIPAPDGFGVLRAVAGTHLPAVIFVTAHDQFAVAAFDVHAVDYLLKPVDQERVRRAVDRLRKAVSVEADLAHDRLGRLLGAGAASFAPPAAAPETQRLVVRSGHRYRLLDVDAIEWLESAGNYVRIHADGGTQLMRSTLRQLEEKLDPARFVRIHRRMIVNMTCVAEIIPGSHGDCDLLLRGGRRLRLSRSYRRNVLP